MLGWPLGRALALSLHDVRIVGAPGAFVGLDNYARVLARPATWHAGVLSLVWVVANAALQTALALGAALVLNQRFPGVRLARTWVMLSWIVPTVVTVIVWRWLFSSSGGAINPLLVNLGIVDAPIGFFSGKASAFATLVFVNSWRWFPFVALLMLAALARIPVELHEAARLDGAGTFARFRRITWPLMAPTLAVLAIIGTLLSFNVFDIIWLVTAGGPADGTRTLPVLIYETAFRGYRVSEAATLSVLVTFVLMGLAALAARLLLREEPA